MKSLKSEFFLIIKRQFFLWFIKYCFCEQESLFVLLWRDKVLYNLRNYSKTFHGKK